MALIFQSPNSNEPSFYEGLTPYFQFENKLNFFWLFQLHFLI